MKRPWDEVTWDEGNDEEADPKEDGNSSDDMDEVFDLLGDWRLPSLETRGESCNPAHHCVVSNVDHHPNTGSLNGVCREESKISCLEGVLRCKYSDQLDKDGVI